MRVLFLHGLESSPTGEKVTRLRADPRYDVTAPQLPTEALAEHLRENGGRIVPPELVVPSIDIARAALAATTPDVVVGSSFGGGLAAMFAADGTYDGPLVLLAPALKRFGIRALAARPGRVVVVHGRGDDVVPLAGSTSFAAASSCEVVLRLVDDDHRLRASVAAGVLDEAIDWATR